MCRLPVPRHQANHKLPGFCFYKFWGLQTPVWQLELWFYAFSRRNEGQSLPCLTGVKILPSQEKRTCLNTRDAEVTSYLGTVSNSASLGKYALSAEGEGEC